MAKESIQFSLGLDGGPFMAGLRGALNAATFGIGPKITAALGSIGVGLSAAGIIAAARNIADYSGKIRDTATSLGVTTDFLQGFGYAAQQAGSTAQAASKGIEVLSRKISEAANGEKEAIDAFKDAGIAFRDNRGVVKSVEVVMAELADRLASTTTGTDRVRIAFDLLGKSGVNLIATLKPGAKALGDVIETGAKLSQRDIALWAQWGDEIVAVMQRLKVFAGSTVAGTFRAFTMSSRERRLEMAKLGRQARELASAEVTAAEAKKRIEERETAKVKERERMMESFKRQEEINLDYNREKKRLEELVTSQKKAQLSIEERISQLRQNAPAGTFTLGELAQQDPTNFGRVGRTSIATAQEVLRLEQLAKGWRAEGQEGRARQFEERAQTLRDRIPGLGLQDRSVKLQEEAARKQSEIETGIQALNKAVSEQGIVVRKLVNSK